MPIPPLAPIRTLSLSALRPRQTEESEEHFPPERSRHPQNWIPEKKDVNKKLSELRSVLQGVLGKREEKKEEARRIPSTPKAAQELVKPAKSPEQKTGALRAGEAIKL